jgi:hypothetical protein
LLCASQSNASWAVIENNGNLPANSYA